MFFKLNGTVKASPNPTTELWVESNTTDYSEWPTVSGSEPYLDDSDSYIYQGIGGLGLRQGYFLFEDSTVSGTINEVNLSFEAYYVMSGETVQVYIYNGSWHDLGAITVNWEWRWEDVDVSSYLTTWDEIDAAKIYFNTTGYCYVQVRRAKLVIDYTPTPPTYSNNQTNTTLVGKPCNFTLDWTDNDGLSGYIFSTNNTGTWGNSSWISMTGTSNTSWNVTTLNSTEGTIVQWKFYANNTGNAWNVSDAYNLTTTDFPTYSNNQTNDTTAGKPILFSLNWTDGVGLSGYIFSWYNGANWGIPTNWTLTYDGFETDTWTVNQECPSTKGSWEECNQGDGYLRSYAHPNNGTYALTFADHDADTDYLIDCWDLSSYDKAYVTFYWKTVALDTGEYGKLDVNKTGSSWTEIFSEGGDSGYNLKEIDLTDYMSSYTCLKYHALMDATAERFYVDDFRVIGENDTSVEFLNDTWVSMTGTGNWSNVTKTVNSTVGATIKWKVFANDTSNLWNASLEYSFVTTLAVNYPQWVYGSNSTNTTTAGQPCNFTLNWTDAEGLSGYIFSTNNTGAWTNSSWSAFPSSNVSWNVTTLNSSVKTLVQWRFYANDTDNYWNASDIFNLTTILYGWLNVTLLTPSTTSPTNIIQNTVFWMNATVTCEGTAGATCGSVNATPRYNKTLATPDEPISTTRGATPFYIAHNILNFSVGSQDSKPGGITQNGTYIWITGRTNDHVYQYFMNGTYTGNSFNVSNEDTTPDGITQNDTHIWVVGADTGAIYLYHMNGTYTGVSYDISGQDGAADGLTHNYTHFWMCGAGNDNVYLYFINGTYIESFSVGSQDNLPEGVAQDGTYIYVVGATNNKVFKYYMNGTYTGKSFPVFDSFSTGICQNGTHIWTVGYTNDKVELYYKSDFRNPESCGSLGTGQECRFDWIINATTLGSYLIDVNFTSSLDIWNDTDDATITTAVVNVSFQVNFTGYSIYTSLPSGTLMISGEFNASLSTQPYTNASIVGYSEYNQTPLVAMINLTHIGSTNSKIEIGLNESLDESKITLFGTYNNNPNDNPHKINSTTWWVANSSLSPNDNQEYWIWANFTSVVIGDVTVRKIMINSSGV